MLAARTAAVIVGSAGVSNHIFDEGADGYATLMVAGMFVGLGSIPLFISAANFKGKASILLHY